MIRTASGSTPSAELRLDVQKAMQSDVSAFRIHNLLQNGNDAICSVSKSFQNDLKVSVVV
ncbi:hypothetical protein BJ875DRAFT_94320 [Amylocarpus encephaloides]|uniref:Uncharacterized protein n=1 Tax=Amylocarpus encephaloides TaxID=45428 RepID=A0A9P7YER3_9HELO|nr:hypothetical protein BJ875DRAFT_94320 [Amylocarpus encephaloides]